MRFFVPIVIIACPFTAQATQPTPAILTELIEYAIRRSDNDRLPIAYRELQAKRWKRQSDVLQANTCADIQLKSEKTLAQTVSPQKLLNQIVSKKPELLIVGESHAPRDFSQWEKHAIEQYRKLRPDVDCVFTEAPLHTIDAELKFFGEKSYRQTQDIEKTVESFAKLRGFAYQSFRKSVSDVTFNMKVGAESPVDSFATGELVPTDLAYVRYSEIQSAFDKKLKIIPVDMRHRQHNRDVFMATMMAGLIKKRFCKAGIAIVGMGHVGNIKQLVARDGVSNYTVALWPSNSFELKDPTYGNHLIHRFLDFSKTCPLNQSRLPTQPFAVVSEQGFDFAPRDGEAAFKFTVDSFDAHIVAPVLPVEYDDSNIEDVKNIFADPVHVAKPRSPRTTR